MISNEIELSPSANAKFEKNQLILNDEMNVREWKELGHSLASMQGNIQFWIGDWIRFGNKRGYLTHEGVYDEAEEITGLERQTLMNYKWVAERTLSTRVESLSFAHHRAVAKLGESEQIYYLGKAEHNKLSTRELILQIIHEETPGIAVRNTHYDNNGPFPIRLGVLHLKLQQEAFEMKSTIHDRVLNIIKEYFDSKEGVLIAI